MSAQQLSTIALIFCVSLSLSLSEPEEDLAALLAFKASSDPSNSLSSWLNSSDPCSAPWLGVACDPTTHRITGLFLEDLNLAGTTQPLTQLAHLRHLSLKRNLLSSSSSSPLNLSSWPHLKHLYLSHNRFGGVFPNGISHLHRLRRLDLSHNSFSGEIPLSQLTRLPHLLTLRLESNSFTGDLNSVNPSSSSSISDFNASNNNLTGEIPRWLSQFPASSFAGNKHLCGKPLPYECSNLTVDNGSRKDDHIRTRGQKDPLAPVYICADAAAVLGIIVAVTCCVIKRRNSSGTHTVMVHGLGFGFGFGSGKTSGTRGKGEEKEMVVFEGCKGLDEVGDLLKASAELLGNGCMGSSYKVVMDGGDVVVAKMVRGRTKKKEVDDWLRLIGGMRHGNMVSLRAYHHSNHQLLLVYDFIPNGSLHSLLHGNRGPGRTPLEWSTRIKAASDSAHGLAFLHSYNKAKLFHGHLTSSNIILLDHSGTACISDVGLHHLFPATASSSHDAYKAPELILSQRNNFTQKCDVYSFGVILLEILTGRMAVVEEGEMDLVKWVLLQRVAKEECCPWEVLDFELLAYKEMELEMMALLQLALLCVAQSPRDRPKMSMVRRMIEDIRMRGTGGEVGAKSIFNDLSFDSSPAVSIGNHLN